MLIFSTLMRTILKVFIEYFTIASSSSIFSCFVFFLGGHKACGILAPRLGIKSTPPALEGKVLTTGLPGKSPSQFCSVTSWW